MKKRNMLKWFYPLFLLFCVVALIFSLLSCDQKESMAVDSQREERYILNLNSKKIHKESCGTAKLIHQENRQNDQGGIEELLDCGYTVCGNCFS